MYYPMLKVTQTTCCKRWWCDGDEPKRFGGRKEEIEGHFCLAFPALGQAVAFINWRPTPGLFAGVSATTKNVEPIASLVWKFGEPRKAKAVPKVWRMLMGKMR